MEWMFVSWDRIGMVVASTAAMYASVLIGVRLAGRRTLTQMSAFDFVVTVAIGSLAATVSVQADPPVAEGVGVLATLLVLQAMLAYARRRWHVVQRLLDFAPRMAVRDGSIERRTLSRLQVTEEELLERLRQAGVFRLDGIALAIIEPTGGISLLQRGEEADELMLRNVRR